MNAGGRDAREASQLAAELADLLSAIGDSTLTVALCYAPLITKYFVGESGEVLRFAQRVIDLAEGDATKGALVGGSPLAMAIAMRGMARCCLGQRGWKEDLHEARAMADRVGELTGRVGIRYYSALEPIVNGVLASDTAALCDAAETLAITEQLGDDYLLLVARITRAVTLIHHQGADREAGVQLLLDLREAALKQSSNQGFVPLYDLHIAKEHARLGDIDGAVEMCRAAIDVLIAIGAIIWIAPATAVLVEALLRRGADSDLREARLATDRLAALPTEPGFVLHDIWLLRLHALLAQAQGDDGAYRDYRDRYRATATSLGFEGHMQWAEAMP
ncbi:MAG: hypothetical protein WAM92_09910 [Mycobacterium sp.]